MEARALLASFVLAALAAQAFVSVVEARATPQGEDVKKPDCVPGVDPHTFPGITPVPSHGGITPVPSHGGGGYVPSPSHGSSGGGPLPTPAHGGGSRSSPSTGGGYGGSPSHGSAPSSGGGAYGSSPSTPGGGGAYGGGSPSPSGGGAYSGDTPAPTFGDSPSSSHGGVGTPTPMPFVPVDPHSLGSLPASCDYWRSHPMEIWSALSGSFPGSSMSSMPSMSHFFGGAAAGGVGGAGLSIVDALGNTRSDGAGALLREGAAALLNSMTRAGFPYTTAQVRDAFAAGAGGSDGAAAAQAAAFKKANEAGKA